MNINNLFLKRFYVVAIIFVALKIMWIEPVSAAEDLPRHRQPCWMRVCKALMIIGAVNAQIPVADACVNRSSTLLFPVDRAVGGGGLYIPISINTACCGRFDECQEVMDIYLENSAVLRRCRASESEREEFVGEGEWVTVLENTCTEEGLETSGLRMRRGQLINRSTYEVIPVAPEKLEELSQSALACLRKGSTLDWQRKGLMSCVLSRWNSAAGSFWLAMSALPVALGCVYGLCKGRVCSRPLAPTTPGTVAPELIVELEPVDGIEHEATVSTARDDGVSVDSGAEVSVVAISDCELGEVLVLGPQEETHAH